MKLLLEETVNDLLRKRATIGHPRTRSRQAAAAKERFRQAARPAMDASALVGMSHVPGCRAEELYEISSHSLAGWQLRCGRLLPSFGAHAQFRPLTTLPYW
jgi:hypothetical protein